MKPVRMSQRLGLSARWLAVVSVVLVALLLVAVMWKPTTSSAGEKLVVYCAAGIKPPVDAAAKQFEQEYGVQVEIRADASGALVASINEAREGDLFIPADDSFMDIARKGGNIAEAIPLAKLNLVVATPPGNPGKVQTLGDLNNEALRVGVCSAQAAVGKVAQQFLTDNGMWPVLQKRAIQKPTVNALALDVQVGQIGAAFIWDAVAKQYKLDIVPIAGLEKITSTVSVGVLKKTVRNPTLALRFARYLAASDRGGVHFAQQHYQTIKGDIWAWEPTILVFTGGLNRNAIKTTVEEFGVREGIKINTKADGCGNLVSQMKAGERPDLYVACDVSFLNKDVTSNWFDAENKLTTVRIVIITPKNNPRNVKALEDLAQPGLKLGAGRPGAATLGDLTVSLLKSKGLHENVWKNVVKQTPTADMLVPDVVTGALDAAIVYEPNVAKVKNDVLMLIIPEPLANATQPLAVGAGTLYPQLCYRLKARLMADESRARFESLGFRWVALPPTTAGDQ